MKRTLVIDDNGQDMDKLGRLLREHGFSVTELEKDGDDRNQAHEELRRTNDTLRAIIESAPTAIIGLDLEGKVRDVWNPAAEKMLGWSAQEVMGRPLPSVPVESREEFRRFREWIHSGRPLNGVEVSRRKRDGTPIEYSIYASPLHDAEGRITGNIGVLVDITDRKRTESVMSARMRLLEFAATHTLDELLEATLNEAEALTGSCIGFYHYLDADQKTLLLQNWSTRTKKDFCNAEGKGLHYDVAAAGVWADCIHQRRPVIHNDYTSLPHRKGLPPGHAPVARELVVPVFRGEIIMAVLGVGNKPGEYTSEDVEVVTLLADFAWEIVERKRTEDALRVSEQKCRAIVEHAPFGICRSSRDGKLLGFNPAFVRILKYDSPEALQAAVNRSSIQEVLFEDSSRRDPLVERIFEGDSWHVFENRYRCGDGSIITCKVHARRVLDQGGSESEFESFLENITERLEAEKALREREAQLQTSLAEKEILLKEVHHRVKNNLQIISSLLDLQSDYIPEVHSRRYIRESQDRIRSMALVHEQLYKSEGLAFIDFARYVDELVTSLYQSCVVAQERIRVKVDVRDIELDIDEAIPCGLIINELVSNALKHAFPGDRSGDVVISGTMAGDGLVSLSVADSGVGLPPGLDFLNTESLGLQIVNLLTNQLRGTIDMQGGEGVIVNICFRTKPKS